MKVTRKLLNDMKIEPKESEENSEDVQKRSVEPWNDGRYENVNNEESWKILEVSKLYYNRLVISRLWHGYFHTKPHIIPRKEVSALGRTTT